MAQALGLIRALVGETAHRLALVRGWLQDACGHVRPRVRTTNATITRTDDIVAPKPRLACPVPILSPTTEVEVANEAVHATNSAAAPTLDNAIPRPASGSPSKTLKPWAHAFEPHIHPDDKDKDKDKAAASQSDSEGSEGSRSLSDWQSPSQANTRPPSGATDYTPPRFGFSPHGPSSTHRPPNLNLNANANAKSNANLNQSQSTTSLRSQPQYQQHHTAHRSHCTLSTPRCAALVCRSATPGALIAGTSRGCTP
jgi:hypothetical protein